MTLLGARPRPNEAEQHDRATRPIAVAGLLAAAWAAGVGLAIVVTLTVLGWVAVAHESLGAGLPGAFRAALQLWLIAHHAGFSLDHGQVWLLPLGLIALPGVLLYRAGDWLSRAAQVPRLRRVPQAALAVACPYALVAGVVAQLAATPATQPSVWQSLLFTFVIAFVCAGAGITRSRASWHKLLRLLPDRGRSLVVGTAGSVATLVAAGAVLVGVSLAMELPQARELAQTLDPGIVGSFMLFVVQVAYIPNAVMWGVAYAVGPGFALGAGTVVAPTGVYLGPVPTVPILAALPDPGAAPLPSLAALAAPFLAGAVGGVLTMRAMPTLQGEVAPLWGFVSGVATGAVTMALAMLSGGSLGGERLVTVGPSGWQVGLVAALEVGVAAAVAAWVTNYLLLRPRR